MLQFSLSEEFAHFYTPLITEMLCLTYEVLLSVIKDKNEKKVFIPFIVIFA